MSSTGRGISRADSDFYPTPTHAVERLLERWMPPGRRWVELGAGTGAIISAVNAFRARLGLPPIEWTAVEYRRECEEELYRAGAQHVVIAPVAEWHAALGPELQFDVSMGNPPFSSALVFAQVSLARAAWTVLLERTPWLADAEDRYSFFIEGGRSPSDEYRVGRVDFDGRGGDSIPYSWFAWPNDGVERRTWQTHILKPTPPEQRTRGSLAQPLQVALF